MSDSNGSIAALFVRVLAIDEGLATRLIADGFSTLEEVGYIPLHEWNMTDGMDEALILVLRNRARAHLLTDAIRGEDDL